MSARDNPPLPSQPFALLLVEGGDERALCEAVAGGLNHRGVHCWNANGRGGLPGAAALARSDANFVFARSVGIVMDVEESVDEARELARQTLAALGISVPPVHATLAAGSLPVGVFFCPDDALPGSVETLSRRAARDVGVAHCVDALLACIPTPHPNRARADKGWLNAYLAMLAKPIRFHECFVDPRGVDPAHACFDPLRAFLLSL